MTQLFKSLMLSCSLLMVLPSAHADALQALADSAKSTQQQEKQLNQQRVALTAEQKAALTAQRNQLAKQLAAIEKRNDELAKQFANNEKALSEQEQQLQLAIGSLGELFGVVRQAAKEVKTNYQDSMLTAQGAQYAKQLEAIISIETLPSLAGLNQLWQAMDYKARSSAELALVQVPYIQGDGKQASLNAIRVGDMGLVAEQGYLQWDFTHQQAANYLVQPDGVPTLASLQQDTSKVLLDPTRGMLLTQFAQQPTLVQRFEQSGVVGKIIAALLLVGLVIGVVRGVNLTRAQLSIARQLKTPQQPANNPLGRILQVYNKEKQQTVESLELRLLESILDEQQGLEKGLSMIKLLAALAPMLGLLGTVTGMIETFQVITQFGNSDPKVMAGGISMALITTVLGLIAAMPLLLVHNVLSNRAEAIRNTLEKQGVSLVAQRAEIELNAECIEAAA